MPDTDMETNDHGARPYSCRRPSGLKPLSELRAPVDWMSIALRAPQLLTAPRGDGRPVMLLPGLMASDLSMRPLGAYLSFLGYTARQWGLGFNQGKVYRDVDRFGERVRAFSHARGGAPVTLIGWSLGGVIARESARLQSDIIREVITLGTPIIGGPKYTTVGGFYARTQGIDMDRFEQMVHERNALGLTQPVTSIYSKNDGIVDWRASVDVYNDHARNIEVNAAHFGLGLSAQVWREIAKTLAASKAHK